MSKLSSTEMLALFARAVKTAKDGTNPVLEAQRRNHRLLMETLEENRRLRAASKPPTPIAFNPQVHYTILEVLAGHDEKLRHPTLSEFYRHYICSKETPRKIARYFRTTERTLRRRKRAIERIIFESFGGAVDLKKYRLEVSDSAFVAADREMRRLEKSLRNEKDRDV